jgi:hypothetical protein
MNHIDRDIIQNYINNFRRNISKYLKKNIGLKLTVYQYNKGVVLSIEFAINGQNKDEFRSESPNIVEAFKRSNIKSFGEISSNMEFGGTNLLMEANRIFIVKDLNNSEWTDVQANNDVEKILTPQNQDV